MVSKALVKAGPQALQSATKGLTQDQVDLIKKTIAVGCTDDELALFVQVCNRTGLDPFSRQIYAIKRLTDAGDATSDKMVIAVSIDGLRLQGQRSNQLNGQEGPFWCGPDGEWKDVWLSSEPPAAAKVVVHRRDCQFPFVGTALWAAYAQKTFGMQCPQCGKIGTVLKSKPPKVGAFCWTKKGGCGANFDDTVKFAMKEVSMARWGIDPAGMLGKCAEALANRKAFPAELSGLYAMEELGAALNITEDVVASAPGAGGSEVVHVEVLPPETKTLPASPQNVATVPQEPTKQEAPVVVPPEAPKPATVTPEPVKAPVVATPPPKGPDYPMAENPEDKSPRLEESVKTAVITTFNKLSPIPLTKENLELQCGVKASGWTANNRVAFLKLLQDIRKDPSRAKMIVDSQK